eukprot:15649-Pelagococcus_subviridis.AAC.5
MQDPRLARRPHLVGPRVRVVARRRRALPLSHVFHQTRLDAARPRVVRDVVLVRDLLRRRHVREREDVGRRLDLLRRLGHVEVEFRRRLGHVEVEFRRRLGHVVDVLLFLRRLTRLDPLHLLHRARERHSARRGDARGLVRVLDAVPLLLRARRALLRPERGASSLGSVEKAEGRVVVVVVVVVVVRRREAVVVVVVAAAAADFEIREPRHSSIRLEARDRLASASDRGVPVLLLRRPLRGAFEKPLVALLRDGPALGARALAHGRGRRVVLHARQRRRGLIDARRRRRRRRRLFDDHDERGGEARAGGSRAFTAGNSTTALMTTDRGGLSGVPSPPPGDA